MGNYVCGTLIEQSYFSYPQSFYSTIHHYFFVKGRPVGTKIYVTILFTIQKFAYRVLYTPSHMMLNVFLLIDAYCSHTPKESEKQCAPPTVHSVRHHMTHPPPYRPVAMCSVILVSMTMSGNMAAVQ